MLGMVARGRLSGHTLQVSVSRAGWRQARGGEGGGRDRWGHSVWPAGAASPCRRAEHNQGAAHWPAGRERPPTHRLQCAAVQAPSWGIPRPPILTAEEEDVSCLVVEGGGALEVIDQSLHRLQSGERGVVSTCRGPSLLLKWPSPCPGPGDSGPSMMPSGGGLVFTPLALGSLPAWSRACAHVPGTSSGPSHISCWHRSVHARPQMRPGIALLLN